MAAKEASGPPKKGRAQSAKKQGGRSEQDRGKGTAKKKAEGGSAAGRPGGSLEEYRRKRDFGRTAEPKGKEGAAGGGGALHFVIQKHAASHLHFDLRLEMGGVMRSWAVPKGPSLNPAVKRLAMEVEDHPMEYNSFEGTIPEGEYGGGTVMIWDEGSYEPEIDGREDVEKAALRGYRAGKLAFTLLGKRLEGSFTIVRTDTVEGGARSKWLLMKNSDEFARAGREITEEVTTSATTGRTMEEIAAGKDGKRVWRSNRPEAKPRRRATKSDPAVTPDLRPMLASTGTGVPKGDGWIFEPKYDGIRVLAFATAESAALITRNGHDKATQFPEVVAGLRELSRERGSGLVLDGEIVPIVDGEIARFEALQARMHIKDAGRVGAAADAVPAALVVFDVLLADGDVLLGKPWRDRRRRLEEVLAGDLPESLHLSETSPRADALLKRGEAEGWEGIIAKQTAAPYRPGLRTSDWVKLKLENRQELVVGGWTEPRRSRPFLGAVLLGYYDSNGEFVYAGHTGTGFDAKTLSEAYSRLRKLERKTSPFKERPRTNERAHWATPRVVVEVKFNEWTRDGKLRQPVFLGFRDDKDAREVVREAPAGASGNRVSGDGGPGADEGGHEGGDGAGAPPEPSGQAPQVQSAVAKKIGTIAESGGDGELRMGRGGTLPLSNLGKTFFPKTGNTKGDLLQYYADMADHILPRMKDRPLVLKRFPNGVEGEAFYQQAAPDSVPTGVRVETLEIEGKKQRRLVGGNLATLLYTIQLGAVSFDPWHSRVVDLDSADYSILDLDPGPGAGFGRVVQVARWVKEEMDDLGLVGALKTSGSSGLHIYLPLRPGTPLDASTLVAQIVATRVAQKHPKYATVERMTRNRPHGTIYVDYLQNILGKTVAGVYAIRARPTPTVSTPLRWEELTDELDARAYTIETVPGRVAAMGDPWVEGMRRPNRPEDMVEKARAG